MEGSSRAMLATARPSCNIFRQHLWSKWICIGVACCAPRIRSLDNALVTLFFFSLRQKKVCWVPWSLSSSSFQCCSHAKPAWRRNDHSQISILLNRDLWCCYRLRLLLLSVCLRFLWYSISFHYWSRLSHAARRRDSSSHVSVRYKKNCVGSPIADQSQSTVGTLCHLKMFACHLTAVLQACSSPTGTPIEARPYTARYSSFF